MIAVDRITGLLLKGSAVSMAVRVAGVALGYVVQVLLSRLLGLHDYGLYAIALGWALVLVLPARMGFESSALRYSTIYLEQGDAGRLRGFIVTAIVTVVVSALVAATAMTFLAGRLSPALPRSALLWGAASILPLALLTVLSSIIRTSGRIFAAQFYEQFVRPAALILLVAGMILAGRTLTAPTALIITAASAAIALVALVLHLRKALAPAQGARPDFTHWQDWIGLSLPLLVIGVTQELLNQLEIILLGSLGSPQQAGLFAAAWRLASLAPFVLSSLGAVSGPLIASAFHRGDQAELQRIVRVSARLGLGSGVVGAALLLVLGRPLLGFFGPEFPTAFPALAILLVGALANAFTGLVAYLLTLTGRQVPALVIFGGALVLSLVLNVTLIPRLGIVGAAIASASAVTAWNLIMWVYVRRTLGIDASVLGLSPRPEA